MDNIAQVKGEGLQMPASTTGQANSPQQSPDKIYAERLNMLARQERIFRQREAQFKDMERKLSDYEGKFSKLKESPLEGLEEFGLKYDDLVVKGMTQDPTAKLESKIAKLEQMLTEKDSKDKQSQESQQKEQWISVIRDEVKEKDDFDLINTLNAHSQVLQMIESHYEETGEQLPIEEAAQMVESDLMSKLKIFQNSKKMRTLFDVKQEEAMERVEDKMSPTLSNNTSNIVSNNGNGVESEQERVKRAIEFLKSRRT